MFIHYYHCLSTMALQLCLQMVILLELRMMNMIHCLQNFRREDK